MNFVNHSIFLIFLVGLGYCDNIRRLIIDGNMDSLNSNSYGVAILQCIPPSSGRPFYQCGVHCSGSLVGPNVVLTAAHCVRDTGLPYGDPTLYVDFDSLYVLVGSTDYDVADWSKKSKLVQVKSAEYHSYGDNLRFESDGDIALLELEECVDVMPGQIEYVKVATTETETPQGECIGVSVAGYGLISNAPAEINDGDGIRRHIFDWLHSFETCRDSFIAAAYGWTTANEGIPDAVTRYTVIPENLLCTGGSSTASVCYGDSGGPTVDTGLNQVISVTSFGIGNFCTTSADYSTRVAHYAEWIHSVMSTKFSHCPGWDIADSFASFPVPAALPPSAEWTASRCSAEQWQCPTGACISKSKVCDGTRDCGSGGADEDSYYCSYVSGNRVLFAKSEPSAENQEDNVLAVELKNLLARKADDMQAMMEPGEDDLREHASVIMMSGSSPPGVYIGGVLRTAGKKARHAVKKVENVVPKATPSSSTCSSALSDVNNGIVEAKSQDTRDDRWNSAPLESQCNSLLGCSGSKPNGFSDASSFCYDLLSFISWNATLPDYAQNFGARFNATCEGELPSGVPVRSATTTPKGSFTASISAIVLMMVVM